MRIHSSRSEHLTYCTNVHPGETWTDVRRNVEQYVIPVKNRLAPDQPFGIGLRLSAAAADELKAPHILEEFKTFLDQQDLYIFTLNGFPYGRFHHAPVKADVYLPDWRDEERVRYTKVLADILATLLPGRSALYASISTIPGAFKSEIRTSDDIKRMSDLLIEAVIHLMQLKAQTCRHIALALEPEPCCFLETVDEIVAFFHKHLFSSKSIDRVANELGLVRTEAEPAIRSHLGICLDLCHAAVEYEDPGRCLQTLREAGIQIFKMQISAGLRCASMTRHKARLLGPLEDGIYLHQVVERRKDRLVRYTDIDKAVEDLESRDEGREWRIHFHVPIFMEELGEFQTTQTFIQETLEIHRKDPISSHLEVETYTWSVLPPAHQSGNIVDDICRELEWVHQYLRR